MGGKCCKSDDKDATDREGEDVAETLADTVLDADAPDLTATIGTDHNQDVANNDVNDNLDVVRPTPEDKADEQILKAIFDYSARETDDLDFKQGDKFLLLEGGEEPGWWEAKHLETRNIGYVPSTYVVIDSNSTQSQEWWFDMNRSEANKQLTLPGNPNGTFLVRESSEKDTYALSVRLFDPKRPHAQGIKNYKIRFMNESKKCFVNTKHTFTSVTKLIDHYKENMGLCCKLVKACPKEPEAVPFKELEIERESIRLLEKLGAGNFGEVWRGKWRNQVEVAVKTLKPKSMEPYAFLEEAKIMHTLQHRKLVQLMGVCTKEEPMYIITELMVNGSLRDYLREEGKDKVTFMTLIEMAAQISDGMSYLEKKNFIHRDVRAANMLVGENNTTKVAVIGLARVIEDDEYTATGAKFPVKWTAPEAIHLRRFTTKSDVWSFGVLLYELVTYGRNPYPGMSNQEVAEKVEHGYRMARPPGSACPVDVYDTMKNCWNDNPEKRPTFENLFKFFDKYTIPVYDDEDVEIAGREPEVEDEANRYDENWITDEHSLRYEPGSYIAQT